MALLFCLLLIKINHADLVTHTYRSAYPDLHSYRRVFVFHAHWAVSVCRADSDTFNCNSTISFHEVSTSPMSWVWWQGVFEKVKGEAVLF
jgi:hypothetical protein